MSEKNILEEKQNEIGKKILEDLLKTLFDTMKKNEDIFTPEDGLDLIFTILITFNKEVLIHIITVFRLENDRKDIMKYLFENIKGKVNNRIKKQITFKGH